MSQVELRGLVLGILVRHEAYGVEIAAALAARPASSAEGSDLPEGAVYPALRWLERHGLALTHWVDVGAGAPRRRYYVLTPKGARVAAQQALRNPHSRLRPSLSAVRS
jgi:PadR family transcriptional regulator PadR